MARRIPLLLLGAFLVLAVAVAAARPASAPASQGETVLVGAGDIASCTVETDEATAKLLDAIPGTVFTTGDNVYYAGTPAEFAACYGPTWGRHKARTRPAPGNHDYTTPGGAGYFSYFGDAAGPVGKGYYAYTAGHWRVIVLNSNCVDPTTPVTPDMDYLGNPCGVDSPQGQWLRGQLESSPKCTLAIIHHPRFTSGAKAPGYQHVQPFWELLYQHGAELVLSGDDHVYERFAPQTPDGIPDPLFGVRQITVGTGGMTAYDFTSAAPNSEVFAGLTHGVLKLTLRKNTYRWAFVPIAGQTFTDGGSADCH